MTDIAALTAENGGGTFDSLTLAEFRPSDGYAVGIAEGTAALVTRMSQVAPTARRIAQEWGSAFVGTWLDDETGRVHIDPVAYVRDPAGDDERAFTRAAAMGRTFGQLAIYSFAKREVIYL